MIHCLAKCHTAGLLDSETINIVVNEEILGFIINLT